MFRTFRFMLYITLKYIGRLFYFPKTTFITPIEKPQWKDIKLICFLNHTSLYEPLYLMTLPNRFLWHCAGNIVAPIADKTTNRKFVGKLFNLITPHVIPVSRKRDETWDQFKAMVAQGYLTVIFPEGRMKRADGLDSQGKPMSIRGGIYDLIQIIEEGKMLICYSGGLHHIQTPGGKKTPKVFKAIEIKFETIDIQEYKKLYYADNETNSKKGRLALIADLTRRQEEHTPPQR